jgi:CubicO group peptidase (beta-lactamase class C family)
MTKYQIMKSGKRRKSFIAILTLLMLALGSLALWPKVPRQPDSVQNAAEFESYLQKLVDNGTVPGLSLVIVKDDSIVYSKGFGWADKPRKMPANPQSVYHWYSITKIVTAIAILQLQEQVKLQLDDSVTRYLPFFKVKYPSNTSQVITIRNLLNHSAGLPNPQFRLFRWIHYEGDPSVNQTDLVKKVMPNFSKLLFEPGEDSRYSNFDYMVLGAIIEKVTGQTYEEYVRQHILQPLGMNHTDFIYTKAMEPFEAAGANPVWNKWTLFIPFIKGSVVREKSGNYLWLKRFYNDQTPSTALIGSAEDAARLAIAYLNKGELNGHRILTEQSIVTMTHDSHIEMKAHKPNYFFRQGIGWQIYKGRGEYALQHDGGGFGFSTIMRLYPDEKLGFILFANDGNCKGWRILNLADKLEW